MNEVYIAKSKINSKGIFTNRSFQKNEIIFKVEGPVVHYPIRPDYRIGLKWLNIAHNKWIIPLRSNPWWSMRHSCNPNTGLLGKNKVVAMKNIKKDEEVTIDNSITETQINWKMNCNCNSKNCRTIIRSVQFLPTKLFSKYKNFISPFFKKAYLMRTR